MKKIRKQFAVKLWLETGEAYVTIVTAFDKKEAYKLANKKAEKECCLLVPSVLPCRVKELPTCAIRTVFGRIPLKAEPNPYYDNEIIINDKRINLPGEFDYWDINSIVIHNAGLPVIATITTDKGIFVVQNNIEGCGKRFEIIK